MQETGVEDHAPHMVGEPRTTLILTEGAGSARCQGQAGTILERIKTQPQVLFSLISRLDQLLSESLLPPHRKFGITVTAFLYMPFVS